MVILTLSFLVISILSLTYTLRSKNAIDKYAKLFIVTLIKLEKFKYSYGRQANKSLPYIEIKLPVDSNDNPDFQFMSNYMKSLPYGDKIWFLN